MFDLSLDVIICPISQFVC